MNLLSDALGVSAEKEISTSIDKGKGGYFFNFLLATLAIKMEKQARASFSDFSISKNYKISESSVLYPYYDDCAAGDLIFNLYNWLCFCCNKIINSELEKITILEKISEIEKYIDLTYPENDHVHLFYLFRKNKTPIKRISPKINEYKIGYGNKQRSIWNFYSDTTSYIATRISTDKSIANDVLLQHGLPVPRQFTVRDIQQARQAADTIGYPVVVKPQMTDHGVAVSVSIKSGAGLASAFSEAAKYGPVIIEKHIVGSDYRILVIDGKAKRICRRVPAHVIGDGKSSIKALIASAKIARLAVHDLRGFKFVEETDPFVHKTLDEQGLDLESVPNAGQTVWLRQNANVSTGGTNISVIDRAHPDNLNMAERAAEAVGLDIAGIDFVTPNIEASWREVECGICDINPTPGMPYKEDPTRLYNYFTGNGSTNLRIPIMLLAGLSQNVEAKIANTEEEYANGRETLTIVRDGCVFQNGRPICGDKISFPRAINIALYDRKSSAILVILEENELHDGISKFDYIDKIFIDKNLKNKISGISSTPVEYF